MLSLWQKNALEQACCGEAEREEKTALFVSCRKGKSGMEVFGFRAGTPAFSQICAVLSADLGLVEGPVFMYNQTLEKQLRNTEVAE